MILQRNSPVFPDSLFAHPEKAAAARKTAEKPLA
jgi:hypothetical protein